MVTRARRGDARRVRPTRAPLRRCGPAPRSSGRTVPPARIPPDRGVPGVEPRPGPVSGRRLRRGRCDPRTPRSRRPRRLATFDLLPSRACISAAFSARSGARTAHAPRSRPRARGITPSAAASSTRSVNASSRRWTPPTGNPTRRDRLREILEEARRNGDAHVEVFALDALAAHRGGRRRQHARAHPARSGRRPVRRRVALHHRAGPGRRALTDATVKGSRRSLRPPG